LKEEAAKNLQSTSNYRELQKQRVQAQREADEEAAKLAAESGKEAAENAQKMGELALAAERQRQALADSGRHLTIQQRIDEETKAANDEYQLKLAAMQQEAAALNQGANDHLNKQKEIQDKEKQLTQEHENSITQIKDQAQMERNQKIIAAEHKYEDAIASGLTKVLMGHQSFAAMMSSLGNEVESDLLQMAIKHIETNLMTKQSDAAAAARKAYVSGEEMGGPIGVVLGPVMAATAYAGVMAFQKGTDYVPGVGKGDKVPAMLEPGEGVVPGGVMDNLRSMARTGNMSGGGNHYHAHVNPTYHLQALDASGMDKVLENHSDTLTKHVTRTLRKMNR
jgi:hypothetical protein